MNELKTVLAAFLAGQAEFAQVDAVLTQTLQSDPSAAPSAFAAIDQIYKSGRLPLQLYVLLKNRIAQSHAAARTQASAPPPPPASAPPPAPPPPQDRTIFNPGAAAGGQVQTAPPAQKPQAPPPAQTQPPRPQPVPPQVGQSQTPPPLTAQPQVAPPRGPQPQTPAQQPSMPPPVQAQPPRPQPAPPPRVEPPPASASEPEAPSGDRTIMRGRPSPRVPSTSQPYDAPQPPYSAEPLPPAPETGAGPVTGPITGRTGPDVGPAGPPTGSFDLAHATGGAETSQTGASTGRTSNTGTARTGTGSSSWTDPAKWDERPQVALERGSVLKGRFVLENVVGRGGMGVVFRAKDLRKEEAQDRDPYVAVKILNDEFRRHPESLKALQREARKSQQLAHPNIVSVFDFDRDGGTVYMTMEFLEGEALDRIIKNPKFEGMTLGEAYPLIRGLGSALSYAHDKGIVHSDFKPGNCFLTSSGVIKVFDFGIAQAAKLKGDLQGEETKFDAGSLGALTPAYASCEMIAGEQPDTRDDIYALGCVVYELLTGKHPFGKKSAADARNQKLVPPTIKQLTRRQWRAIEKSLAFRRADRSATVWELVDGLAKQQLFSAPRIAVGAAAIVVLGVGAYFGVGVWQQAQRDRLVTALSSKNDAQVLPALERVAAIEVIDDRNALLTQVTGPLLDWYEQRIDAAANKSAGRYDYPRAAAIAEEAKRWYPDSARIQKKAVDTAQEGAQLAVDLVAQFTEALDAGRLLPDPANVDVAEVLDILSQVQPGHQTLTSPTLAFAYATQASDALRAKDADVTRAAALIEAGLKRFPGNEQLVSAQARLDAVRTAVDEADRLVRLKKTLDDSASRTVADLLKLKDTAADLANLSPGDDSLRGYRGRLSAALRDEVQAAVNASDLDKAQGLLDSVDDALLPVELKRQPQNLIADARRTRDRQRQDLLAAITNAANAGNVARLTEAEARLRELRALPGVDANMVQTGHDRVLQGYLTVAQKQNNANQFPDAKATVKQGLTFEPNQTDLLAMEKTIADREDALAKGNKAAADEAVAKAQQTVRDDVQKILAKPTLSYLDAKDVLDKMKKLPEGDPLYGAAGVDQVAQRLANQARALGTSQQQWQQAVASLDQALNLIPGSKPLEDARDEAQSNLQTLLVAQAQRTLEQRTANATDDEAWSKGVRDLITQLRGLVPEGDPRVAKAERDAATALVARAGQARERKDFNVAERLLRSAGSFSPSLEELAAEQQRVAAAKDAATAVVISERQKTDAQIADLKSLFETQAKADNPTGVIKARDDLKKLSPNDPYLETARQKIAEVYLHVATNRLADKELDNAERFAQQGLRELPNYQPLVALSEKIATDRGQQSGAALDRDIDALRAQIQAGSGDANSAKTLRDRVRSATPEARFTALDQELVGIADQRLASNPTDDAYRTFASTALDHVFARPAAPPPPPPPVARGVPCTDSLKGTKRACYDAVPGATSDRGPIMVVVPGGAGVSGSFAIGRTELTVGNWNDYCKLSGVGGGDGQCKPAVGGVNDPVASVAVADIEKYAAWLSATTKATYRLPSSAEWLYAATATGEPIKNANCIDPAGRGKAARDTAQNLGQDNGWGLRDVLGNVQEVAKTASGYEVRGGHFNNQLGQCKLDAVQTYDGRPAAITGFRLVRELGPG